MSTLSERNQFRRLVGDYDTAVLSDADIEKYLDDAVYELTTDFTPTPVTDFDSLVVQYHIEVVYKAAINYWWNRVASLSSKHSMSLGAATQNVGEEWDRAMKMIDELTLYFNRISSLGTDITIGNYTRFSKVTLTRLGGNEEAELDGVS